MRSLCFIAAFSAVFASTQLTRADVPSASYIFPAGGERGTTVSFNVGGHFLFEGCPFHLQGTGVEASPRIERTETRWFEGPVIPLPASQAKETYPKDYAGTMSIAPDAEWGPRYWSVSNSQGVTTPMKFIVGDLPEIVEDEISGLPIPVPVAAPVTVNGRIFPREDIDIWSVTLKQGETLTAEVNAARLGSPLDAYLEVRNSRGERVAGNDDHFGADSFLQFVAPDDGVYEIYIRDMNVGGLQHYVYRLTLITGPYVNHVYPIGGRRGSIESYELLGVALGTETAEIDLTSVGTQDVFRFQSPEAQGSVLMPLDDLPEFREPVDGTPHPIVALPAVLNGRISQPGERDVWTFSAKQGEVWFFDVQASRWGSPLDAVLTVLDENGTMLATADDIAAGNSDAQLTWTAPAEGTYRVSVNDRSSNRGDREFAYRLKISAPQGAGFQLTSPLEALNVPRGGEMKWKIDAVRTGGFAGEIQLVFENLPSGITATPDVIPMGQSTVEVVLKADETARITMQRVQVFGKGLVDEQEMVQPLLLLSAPGDPPRSEVLIAVTMPTPFKITGVFESRFAPRGTTHVRHFNIERNGYEGPLEIELADRQTRHLQGVTGPKMTIPEGISEFDYPIQLPPWMEIGRTSRTVVMAIGIVKDTDGNQHKVSYSSDAPDDQIIVLVEPEILTVDAERTTLRAEPGATVSVNVRVGRGSGLTGPVEVALVIPDHMYGLVAEPIVIPAESTEGKMTLQFTADASGPWNDRLILRAVMIDGRGLSVTGESALTIVPAD
ncbi:MAG: PPC domain-containing protein [Planctomycetota bacterium]|nr:PPC domain-containing protein [Planctomycetota bacterium]MDA1214198.1 PPC domain-containing protein [Planctomycetota bacterium]